MEKTSLLANGAPAVNGGRAAWHLITIGSTDCCARPPLPHPAKAATMASCGQVHCVMWCSKWVQLWLFSKPVPTDIASLWDIWKQQKQHGQLQFIFRLSDGETWQWDLWRCFLRSGTFRNCTTKKPHLLECLLFIQWCFLTVVTKHGNTLNLKFKGKKSKEHDYIFRSAITYFKTGQITFEECNHHTIK